MGLKHGNFSPPEQDLLRTVLELRLRAIGLGTTWHVEARWSARVAHCGRHSPKWPSTSHGPLSHSTPTKTLICPRPHSTSSHVVDSVGHRALLHLAYSLGHRDLLLLTFSVAPSSSCSHSPSRPPTPPAITLLTFAVAPSSRCSHCHHPLHLPLVDSCLTSRGSLLGSHKATTTTIYQASPTQKACRAAGLARPMKQRSGHA
jgi:hypothetical protein